MKQLSLIDIVANQQWSNAILSQLNCCLQLTIKKVFDFLSFQPLIFMYEMYIESISNGHKVICIQLCCYLVEFLASETPTEDFLQLIEAMPSVNLLSTQENDLCRFSRTFS